MSAALTREATFDRASADRGARTVRASLSSEAPVMQQGVPEILRHDAASVDLTRAKNGLPLLTGHDRTSLPIGIVENVRIENKRLVGDLRFGSSSRAQEIFNDVADGILRSTSLSYSVQKSEASPDGGYVATRWTPLEASIVSVPADHSVGVGRAAEDHSNSPGNTMTDTTADAATVNAERQRAADITAICTRHKVPAETLSRYIADGTPIDAVRAAILDDVATRDMQTGGHINVATMSRLLGHDQGDQSRALMEAAIGARIGGARASAENPYRYSRMIDLARERLEVGGTRTTAMSQSQLLERALTTSDFPSLLANSLTKVLQQKYTSYGGGLKRVAKATTLRDFRAKLAIRLSEAPKLLQVNEWSEFKYGALADTKEQYSLLTYGRIVSISRQALINDDLGALETVSLRFAQQAMELEAGTLAALLISNPMMSEDSTALFHASHNNLATGGGSALSLTSLSIARKSMRLQTGLDKSTPIDVAPRFLVVPASLETVAQQLVTSITPVVVSEVNPFSNLELVVEPRLDASSATAWYLVGDPNVCEGLEYAHLEGAAGPEMFQEVGFEIDGISLKCREDFGAGFVDYRGWFKSTGA